MIDTQSSATKQVCAFFKETLCNGASCMAWRTLDGDMDAGFCGRVPVLPYLARGQQDFCGGNGGPEIIGDHGFVAATAVQS